MKSRAYFLRPGYNVFASLSVATGVLKLILLILEEIPKASRFVPGPHLTSGSEARSGYWNRTLYVWLNQTLLRGFRKILTVDELGNLGAEFASEYLVSVFLKKWNTGKPLFCNPPVAHLVNSTVSMLFLTLLQCSKQDQPILPGTVQCYGTTCSMRDHYDASTDLLKLYILAAIPASTNDAICGPGRRSRVNWQRSGCCYRGNFCWHCGKSISLGY